MVSLPVPLTKGFTTQVKKGDSVKIGDTLASKTISSEERLPLSEIFSASAKDVGKYLKVNPGDSVKEGDVLAVRKSMFREDKVMSEVAGTVMAYERDSGELIIHPQGSGNETKEEKIVSPIDGIVSLCDNEKIVVDTDRDVVLGEIGSGKTGEGELYALTFEKDSSKSVPSQVLFALDVKSIGKILFAEEVDREVLLKAIGMGVEGIVTSNAKIADLEYLTKRNITTPVISLLIDDFKKVAKWVGKTVYLDGTRKTIVLLHL